MKAPDVPAVFEPAPGPLTEGLDLLDSQRASSLADEGGAAGAAVETQQPPPDRPPVAAAAGPRGDGRLWAAALCGLAALAALYLRRTR